MIISHSSRHQRACGASFVVSGGLHSPSAPFVYAKSPKFDLSPNRTERQKRRFFPFSSLFFLLPVSIPSDRWAVRQRTEGFTRGTDRILLCIATQSAWSAYCETARTTCGAAADPQTPDILVPFFDLWMQISWYVMLSKERMGVQSESDLEGDLLRV